MDLPDFRIPHAEKIEWMVETNGWALEPVAARTDTDPPQAGYAYSIGFPQRFGHPEVLLFGLTPAASNGVLQLIADLLDGGTEIPTGVVLTGLFDGDQRCLLLPVPAEQVQALMPTAIAWHRSTEVPAVQLLWPDRNGFLPTEAGFEQRLRLAQPVVGVAS